MSVDTVVTEEDKILAAIKDFVIAEAKYDQFKATYAAAKETVLALLPKEVGEHSVKAGGFTLTIKYPEKTVWDATQLDALYGGDKPAHVKLSYSIDMRQMRRLPQSEQDQLKQCYETKPGTPAIDIVKE